MKTMRSWAPWIVVLCVGAVALSCSADGDEKVFGDDDDGSSSGGSGPGAGGTGQGGGLGGGFTGPGGGGGSGNTSSIGCSPDLQKVVDGNGAVLMECPPDLGCSEGQCIPACQAAADSKGSIGCDFWAPDPPFYGNEQPGASQAGACFAVFLANAWGKPAQITVSRGGQTFDVTQHGRIPKGTAPNVTYDPIPPGGLPPNEVAVLFLSHRPGTSNATSLECPVPPAVLADAAVPGSGKGQAFHVVSDTPVSAYDILPYGGASSYLPSATLLFPSTAWGTNYIAVSPHPPLFSGVLWALVVAAEDGTTVQINPPVTLPGGGAVQPAPANQTTAYTINAGEILQWVGAEPSSAILSSDKPVGLWTGSTYLAVQTATMGPGGQDSAHQQIPHIKALGSEYAAAGVFTRLQGNQPESVMYRMLGVVDGTNLMFDPPIPGAPAALVTGQVVEFETTQAFRVRSQDDDHPFALTQYMSGTIGSTVPGCGPQGQFGCGLGDEEWVNLVPAKQYLQRYVFFTDPTYATTNLVITRTKGADGMFDDVDIACLGNVTGWQPVGASGQYEYAHVDLVRGGIPVGNCGTSQHIASSNGAFGIIVWGTDWYSSYGYPAGGNVGTINEVVVPTPPPR